MEDGGRGWIAGRGPARAAGLLLALTLSGEVRAEERKSETPQTAHALRVGCAGAAAAAVARSDMAASRDDEERADAARAMSQTRDEALSSGARIGLAPAQVDEAIDRQRRGILKRIEGVAGDPAAATKEEDLGRVVVECALVEALERREKR